LLSPLDIASLINNMLYTLHSSVSYDTSAYIQLLQQQNTLLQNELYKEKEANIKLMYAFQLSDFCFLSSNPQGRAQ
jgi:hypothetical protein